ncbi:MAG: 5-(carboxyamino)imidazole ribonucleotide mutase [Thermoanaerobaculia bacterium]
MTETPLVGVVMGSRSDWGAMEHAVATLTKLGIPHDVRILSAHRTPEALSEWIRSSEEAGVRIFIAAAGMAAHLAGVVAAHTALPVLGVPMESKMLGIDSLLSMVQMPGGIPVPTMTVGKAGAVNAALFAGAVLGLSEPRFAEAVRAYRDERAAQVLGDSDPRK